MQALSRVARESAGRIAVVTATAGAVSTARGPAHAHARPTLQRPDFIVPTSHCQQDDWLVTHVDAGNVFFRPEDIDEVAHEVLQLVPRQAAQIGSKSDYTESEGQEATSIIETSAIGSSAGCSSAGAPSQLEILMRVTSSLLKKPAVQKEVMDVIMHDPELLQLLDKSNNMDQYLMNWGVSSAGLLPSPIVVEDITEVPADEPRPDGPKEDSPLDKLVAQLLSALGRMGETMHGVGSWLKALFRGPGPHPASPNSAGKDNSPGGFFSSLKQNPFLSAAVMLGVGMVCVLLLRRPQMLAALLRQRAVAAAAAGAAGVAAAAAKK